MKRLLTTRHRSGRHRSGFTLVELLVVITIIALLGTMSVGVSRVAIESARRSRTEMTIAKIDTVVSAMYEKYQYKQIDLSKYLQKTWFSDATYGRYWLYTYNYPTNTLWNNYINTYNGLANFADRINFNHAKVPQLWRLHILRDTVRIEMPCWAGDVYVPNENDPNTSATVRSAAVRPDGGPDGDRAVSALTNVYQQALIKITGSNMDQVWSWTPADHAAFNAELLYLMVMNGDPEARSLFNEREIADVNGNGLNEFIDGWGRPIHWLRWCPSLGAVDRSFIVDEVVPTGTTLINWRNTLRLNTDTDRQSWGNDIRNNNSYKYDDDPLDPLGIDDSCSLTGGGRSWLLVPYIFSSGPDGEPGINPGRFGFRNQEERYEYMLTTLYPFQYTLSDHSTNVPADWAVNGDYAMDCGGIEYDLNGNLTTTRLDNIHNHSVRR